MKTGWNGITAFISRIEVNEVKIVGANQHTGISAFAHWHTRQFAFAHRKSRRKAPCSADLVILMWSHVFVVALCGTIAKNVALSFSLVGHP